MKQIAVRVDDGLLAAIEKARGDVPRERWMRKALEAALSGTGGVEGSSGKPAGKAMDHPGQEVGLSARPASPRTPAGTTARGRSPKATHAKPDGPVQVASPARAPADLDPARGLNENRHLRFCKCPVCKPSKGAK